VPIVSLPPLRDGGSRATDDLNRSKYAIADPPVGQLASQA